MRCFYWENAGLPVEVSGQRYTFEVVAKVAGTIKGVLKIEDQAQADLMKAHGAQMGIVEITPERYEEERAKKKSHPLARTLRPNSDPWFRPSASSAPAKPAAAAEAARNESMAMAGKGGAQTVQPVPGGGHEGAPAEQLPDEQDLFTPARVGQEPPAQPKPKSTPRRPRAAAKDE